MAQHSGTFSVMNNTGGTISGTVSHFAEGCPSQTPVTFTNLANGQSAGGGQWQTETTSTDRWMISVTNCSTTKDCAIDASDTTVLVTFNASNFTIAPNTSSSCSGSC